MPKARKRTNETSIFLCSKFKTVNLFQACLNIDYFSRPIQGDKTSIELNTQVGTLNFMSPEAFQDISHAPRFDNAGNAKPRMKVRLCQILFLVFLSTKLGIQCLKCSYFSQKETTSTYIFLRPILFCRFQS